LLKGKYIVEFGLGNMTYPIELGDDAELTQKKIEAGPSCPRPRVVLDGIDDDEFT